MRSLNGAGAGEGHAAAADGGQGWLSAAGLGPAMLELLGLAPAQQRCCGPECAAGCGEDEDIIKCRPAAAPGCETADLRFGGSLPSGPRGRPGPSFQTMEEGGLRGRALVAGGILVLELGESIQDARLELYANGFRLTPTAACFGGIVTQSRTWSPFSLVEKCQVKAMENSSFWAVFKLTVFRGEGDSCWYFATTGSTAHEERDRWVHDISLAIRAATVSLFPPLGIAVQPIPGIASTADRIMAGYLLQSESGDAVSLCYCELCAYSRGQALLKVYTDEWCEQEVASISMSASTAVSTRTGSYCTVFGVDAYRFCARTMDEKELWLRAVSNIKVKLMFDAPEPTDQDLNVFRESVWTRVEQLPAVEECPPSAPAPLLSVLPSSPPAGPAGDSGVVEPPEPEGPPARQASSAPPPGAAASVCGLPSTGGAQGGAPAAQTRAASGGSGQQVSDSEDAAGCGEAAGVQAVDRPRRYPIHRLLARIRASESWSDDAAPDLHGAACPSARPDADGAVPAPAPASAAPPSGGPPLGRERRSECAVGHQCRSDLEFL